MYKTLVRPILIHAAETWSATKNNVRRLSINERKILRRIFGPICERGQGRKRYIREFEQFYNESNIVSVIKSNRLRWENRVV